MSTIIFTVVLVCIFGAAEMLRKPQEADAEPVSADARHIVKHLWIVAVFVPVVMAALGALVIEVMK
jgi:hypothetical protein